ncbi:ubiquitin carboxyl-terminal hydrolase 48 [Synchiropus splendidus]|uniref:ubiquitin carboxyl-terminal hydrolase 48 n=1 Tax=Synchiropus splendidus TaxID=270530 RepID=UPI00237E5800|nr:ubiquitin carboxyl-terminal hydrolase 48 [Synchiropus splendidus]XP_053725064.1 ubiquitin carboxyl-terminal hydrolase 48 [Synchiropus splendidus]
MAPRTQLEKAAWRWVDHVLPEEVRQEHVELAYRVNLPACQRGTCRRNCKGNPNCLVGIGEQAWLGEIDENAFHNVDDPNSVRREKNTFVGLTNLGATCYVNTFLQVWFHNLELRKSLYQCQTSRAHQHDIQSEYEPQSICEHLQYLFALLQNSNRKYIDPSGLVKALGLDIGQQQDAQEFSKLFLSLLEDTLSKQENPSLHNVIQRQFCGQSSYVTVCNRCGRSSSVRSKFYELQLNIQGHKNIAECITEFLQEEKLDGDNLYFCESCQSKQSATRRIQLHSLPPTLNMQLMRFVFDRQTGRKKKLNSYISFPEQLDMRPFLGENNAQKSLYELSAVLIHRGVSAYSGHYIAHVKDACMSDWYKFNDEEIEKMEGKRLQLGVEEDIAQTVKTQTRKPKSSKGDHCSRNAYMLVYKLQEEGSHDSSGRVVDVPAFLQRLVDQDNHKFEEWCNEMADMRKMSVDKGKAKHEEVQKLYQLLPAESGEPYEFIPLDWLKKWLDDSTVTKEIDNSSLLCSHGKLHPDMVSNTKRVSLQAGRILFNSYSGGPRLDDSSLCRECVVQRCRLLRLKNQINEDFKEISNLVKNSPSDGGYWVGKASLRGWRHLALAHLEDEESGPGNGVASKPEPTCSKDVDSDQMDSKDEEMKTFNEDIVCSHGGLSILDSERKLVSAKVWNKLKAYLPTALEFTQNQVPCQQCTTFEQEEKDNEAVSKMMAVDQKNQLVNLFQEKNRPTLSKWPQETDVLYIVPLLFVDEWRKFIRRPTKSSPVCNVTNSLLLCPHGGVMFDYSSLVSGSMQNVALLWPSEWEVIRRLFIVDNCISIHCLRETSPTGAVVQFTTQPDLCGDCREAFLAQQQKDQTEYSQATVYIRKVVKDNGLNRDASSELTASNSEAEPDREELMKLNGQKDPDFMQTEDGTKRFRLSEEQCTSSELNMVQLGIRRSTRHRKIRGEKALVVSANQTLKELKIEIMHAFSVAPFDQNLSINGKSLTDDSATLGSLGIVPESIIFLRADEPIADYAAMDDAYQVRVPEEGFKGTLLGH